MQSFVRCFSTAFVTLSGYSSTIWRLPLRDSTIQAPSRPVPLRFRTLDGRLAYIKKIFVGFFPKEVPDGRHCTHPTRWFISGRLRKLQWPRNRNGSGALFRLWWQGTYLGCPAFYPVSVVPWYRQARKRQSLVYKSLCSLLGHRLGLD
jgi:hypothetical protein